MGTSSPYGGHKDSNPLLPPDYDDDMPVDEDVPDNEDLPPVQPPVDPQQPTLPNDTPWKYVKTAMSQYLTGRTSNDRSGVKHIIKSYGRAAGRTSGLMQTSSPGIKAGHTLAQFLNNNFSKTDSAFIRINAILQSETDIGTALSEIADVISPVPDGKEDAVARDAIISTLCRLYDYMDTNNLDISKLDNLDRALQEQLLTTYVSEYVWGKMLNDLQTCFEKYVDDPVRAANVEKEFKDYIYTKVSVEVYKGMMNANYASTHFDIAQIFHDCYEGLM